MQNRNRDRRILRFIETFGCATTGQLRGLFFPEVSLRRCQQRLARLVEQKRLARDRDYLSTDFLYFVGKKPKEIEHMLARVDYYISLTRRFKLCEFTPEYSFSGLRADAYYEVWQNGDARPYFLEVQLSANFNQQKYEALYYLGAWKEKWAEFPPVVVLSDKRINLRSSEIKYIPVAITG
jgi:hypothetical protein